MPFTLAGMSIRGTCLPTSVYWLTGLVIPAPGMYEVAVAEVLCAGSSGIVKLKFWPPINWP